MAVTVAVTPIKGPHFMAGVANAKRWGGRFDGQVWHIPATRPELSILPTYSLRFATPVAGCALYTEDQGCPKHGEVCRADGSLR